MTVSGQSSHVPPKPAPPSIEPPMVGGKHPHLDIEETLAQIYSHVARRSRDRPDTAGFTAYERKLKKASRWGGWIWGLVSLVGAVFSVGVAYAVFLGANATDDEVRKAVKSAVIRHNGGVDPDAVNPKTHAPVGEHPGMRKAIQQNSDTLKELTKTTESIGETQKKLDKRSEYQFEFIRWQTEVIEAFRQRRRPPPKPKELKRLENEIFKGKYD